MTRTYECMFLIDNDVVRAGWGDAKSAMVDLVRKHGGEVITSRRWDERRLAYPIRHRNRATYLLSFCHLDGSRIEAMRRELDITEMVLRYLLLAVEEVPASERELSTAEEADGFEIPEPPPDDMPDVPEILGEGDQRSSDGVDDIEIPDLNSEDDNPGVVVAAKRSTEEG